MEDREIIEMYFARSEDAIVQTQLKYGCAALRVAENILGREECEECVNDTYLKLWDSIPPQKPKNFKAYICRITRNLALNRLRYYNTQKRGGALVLSLEELSEIVPDKTAADDRELADIISRFLRAQKPDARKVFIRKYWFFDSIEDISQRFGFSENKVKSMLFRTRKALREFLEKEGVVI